MYISYKDTYVKESRINEDKSKPYIWPKDTLKRNKLIRLPFKSVGVISFKSETQQGANIPTKH